MPELVGCGGVAVGEVAGSDGVLAIGTTSAEAGLVAGAVAGAGLVLLDEGSPGTGSAIGTTSAKAILLTIDQMSSQAAIRNMTFSFSGDVQLKLFKLQTLELSGLYLPS